MNYSFWTALWASIRRGASDERGAVTVDWVVMTAGIVVLGTVVVYATRDGLESVASDINTELSAVPVN